MKKSILIVFIIIVIIFSAIVFIFINNKGEEENLQSKTEKEIEYLEEKIISMMNSLNNITLSEEVLIKEKTEKENTQEESQNNEQSGNSGSNEKQKGSSQNQETGNSNSSNTEKTSSKNTKYEIKNNSILVNKNDDIDWEYIKTNAEEIYSTWATTTIDLHALNVNNEDILNFGVVLDQMTISAKQEDKIATLNNLASLYAFFSKYIEQISNDNQKINLSYTKTCVLNSYALVEQNKWDEMKKQSTNAINYFTNIINSINANEQNNTNKIYVLLNELKSSIDLKDKEIFMIKYRNLMDELANF